MSSRTRSFTPEAYLSLAVVIVVSSALWASSAWANRNPTSCTLVSAGLLLGEFRDTARCRGGANNFTQCSADSECPGGRALRGNLQCRAQRESAVYHGHRLSRWDRCGDMCLGGCGDRR